MILPKITSDDIQSIRHVAPHNQRNLLLAEFLDGDLQWVGLSFKIDENGSVHAVPVSATASLPSTHHVPFSIRDRAYLICRARVPRMRAFSYLVI